MCIVKVKQALETSFASDYVFDIYTYMYIQCTYGGNSSDLIERNQKKTVKKIIQKLITYRLEITTIN